MTTQFNVRQNKQGGIKYRVTIEVESPEYIGKVHDSFKEQLVYLIRTNKLSAIKNLNTEYVNKEKLSKLDVSSVTEVHGGDIWN